VSLVRCSVFSESANRRTDSLKNLCISRVIVAYRESHQESQE